MENLILTGVYTPALNFIESLNKDLMIVLFFALFIAIIILSCVAQVINMMTQRSLSKDLYRAKIVQAETERQAALIKSAADVKVAKEKEKDFPQTALLQALLRQMKLDANQVSDIMKEIKDTTNVSSKQASQEFLDDVVKNINNDIDKVSVEDLEALLNLKEED